MVYALTMDSLTDERLTARLGVRVSPSERKQMQEAARKERLPLSTWIRRVVWKALEHT